MTCCWFSCKRDWKEGTVLMIFTSIKDQLDIADGMSSRDDVYTKVFGKEHPGRVRGMGFGPVPSQYLSSDSHSGSSTMPSSVTSAEYDRLKLELEASNARVQVLEGEVAKVKTLEEQIAYLMQTFGGQLPTRFNQVADLGSPAEARPSFSASHEPQHRGPSSV